MITAIEIENFKGIGQRRRIEFRICSDVWVPRFVPLF